MVPRKMCNRNTCTAKETESKKVMTSVVITRRGVSRPYFIGGNGMKMNGASYLKHLRDDLIPAVEAMYPNKDFTFVQESAPSHCANQAQNFLKQKLKSRFANNTYWPLKWPDCNHLDYFFWYRVQEKVYDSRYCYPSTTTGDLKGRIRDVSDESTTDIPDFRRGTKQFLHHQREKKAAQSKLFLNRH